MDPPASPSTLLVIDDHRPNLVLAQAMLESAGYRVVTAESAEQALGLLADFVPDLVLVDVALPGMSGLDLTRRLRADARVGHVPVVALTACAMAGDEARVREAGCIGYVTKPIDFHRLLQVVSETLRGAGRAQGPA
jgi:CheY-like chemotaxis protein